MRELVERQATALVYESWQGQQLEAKRLALSKARGDEWRRCLGALAKAADAWMPAISLAMIALASGALLGINSPRGVVCFSNQPLCHLRLRPMKTIIPLQPPAPQNR